MTAYSTDQQYMTQQHGWFMQTLKKYFHTTTVEGLNWKTQLSYFFRQYRAAPHSTTKTSLFEALTGNKMNIGIPNILKDPIPMLVHTHIAENDVREKNKIKTYADVKRQTKLSPLCLCDKVLIRLKKQNKLSLPYNPQHFTVIKKRGSMVTAQRGNYQILQKSSFFKWINPDPFPGGEG